MPSCSLEITLGSDPAISVITIPLLIWRRAVIDLRRRGRGIGESGAFLLGRQADASPRVSTYICYDDLDSDALQSGAIAFHAAGYTALWKYCRDKKLEVLCDVHTHPGTGVGQSIIDQRHPMVPVAGHTALIVPNFGHTAWWSLKSVGVYEYLGNFNWRTHAASDPSRCVRLNLW